MSTGYNKSDDIVTFGLSYYNGKNYEKINITELYIEERTVFDSKDVYCKEIIDSKFTQKTDLFKIIHICDNKYAFKNAIPDMSDYALKTYSYSKSEADTKYALKSEIPDMSATNELGHAKAYRILLKNQNQENEVRYLSIVFPWSLDALYKSHYLQFDASFHAMKPYAYSITHGIIFNESVPLSIILAPTESEELYQMIINHFNELSKNKFSWNSLPVLSDMGTSIKSVCKKNSIKQVFCHRHILEHFGSATVLAIFCNRLLSSYSFHEYLQISMNVKCELDEFIKEKKKLGKLSIDFLSKVNDLQVMLDGENGDQESNYYYTKWAIWVRREFHICRCSNHMESFHGVLNRSLGLQSSFKKKFSNLIETTLLHLCNLSKRFGSSIIRKLNSLKEMISKKFSNFGFDVMSLCCTACDCEEDIYNSMIFGCEIRCQHQMLLPARDILEKLIKKIDKYNKENNNDKEININNFIKIIIDQKGFINQAMNDFIPDVNQLFLVFKGQECLTYDDLVDLIKSLHLCFKYVNPEFPKISEDNKKVQEL
ncbi:hypothetical protein M9Y10_016305 [Tritrichomonas musculus]|uniref:MULE transposase domain-containing protein n=1 Tax=Tritrichomonas musculus TaxID=1915356 RepID=A0ABR2HVT5_9EUKA